MAALEGKSAITSYLILNGCPLCDQANGPLEILLPEILTGGMKVDSSAETLDGLYEGHISVIMIV